jgi:hypothetical protein
MKKEIDEHFLRLDEYCKDLLDKAIKSDANDLEKVDYLVGELQRFQDREASIKSHIEDVRKAEESLAKYKEQENSYELANKLNRAQDGNDLSKEIVEHIKFLEKEKLGFEVGSKEYFKGHNQIKELCETLEMIETKMESGIDYFDAAWLNKEGRECPRYNSEDLTLNVSPLTEFEQNMHKAELQRIEHMGYIGLDSHGNEIESNLDLDVDVFSYY